MATFNIKEPIWKDETIGLNRDRIDDENYITISYKDAHGNYVFPGTYYIEGEKAIQYPIQSFKGVTVHLVPIKKLERI